MREHLHLHKDLPVQVDPEIMSGEPVFQGTRVPVQTLFDYLLDGYSISEFLDNFPSVSFDKVEKVLSVAGEFVHGELVMA